MSAPLPKRRLTIDIRDRELGRVAQIEVTISPSALTLLAQLVAAAIAATPDTAPAEPATETAS